MKNGTRGKCQPRQVLAGIFMAALLLSGVGGGNATAADDIRIGYTPSLTGIRAGQGANEIKAVQLAVKQINAAGGVMLQMKSASWEWVSGVMGLSHLGTEKGHQ